MHRGYYKRWRKEKDSEIWQMPPLYLKTWDYLLASVDYRTGTLTTTLTILAEGLEWVEYDCPRRPRKQLLIVILDWMEAQQMISRTIEGKGNTRYTKISIENWQTYQSYEDVVFTKDGPQNEPKTDRRTDRLEEVQETKEPPHPAPAHTREEGDLGEGLGVEKAKSENGLSAPIRLQFPKPAPQEFRVRLREEGGYAYRDGIWAAPWSPAASALAEEAQAYGGTLTAPAPLAPASPVVPRPAQQSEPAPVLLPATPPHLQPVLDLIHGQIRPKSWETWFAPCTLAGGAAGLQVWAPSPIIADWIAKNYRPHLEQACQQVLGQVPAIEILVPGATTEARASPPGGPPPSPATEPAAESAP